MILMLNKSKILKFTAALLIITAAAVFTVSSFKSEKTSGIPVNKKIIVIDAGHGTPDGGAVADDGTSEKDINLDVANKLCAMLEKTGAYVIMTRLDDNAVTDDLNQKIREIKRQDLKNRRDIRDDSHADLFVSIHMNKFDRSEYYGAQVFYAPNPPESEKLAKSIQAELIALADPSNTREVKKGDGIFILKNSKIPSVLVECGFLSNPAEREKLKTDEYRDTLAWSIYCGIVKYLE